MFLLFGPGGGTAFGQWGNYFGPMEELLLAVGGTALGYWGNCLCLMGELLLANGGTALGQWGNRIQSLCYNSIKNLVIILYFKLLAT